MADRLVRQANGSGVTAAGRKPLPAKAGVPDASRTSSSPNDTAAELMAAWRLDEALQTLDNQVLSKDPTDQTALQLRADILILRGDLEAARETVDALAQAHPLDPIARRRQLALGLKPEEPSRERVWQHVLSAGQTPRAFGLAAGYLYSTELFEECIEFSLLGITAIGREAKTGKTTTMELAFRNWIARSLEELGEYERAMEVYSGPLAHPRTTVVAATGLARCWLELGHAARAEAVLRAMNSERDGSLPFSGLALDVLQAQGKVAESYRLYRTRPASDALATFFGQPPMIDLDLGSHASALILAEGGPGDELRLSSIYADLLDLVGDLTITCDPRTQTIMERSFPRITFLPAERHRIDFPKPIADRNLIDHRHLYSCVSDTAVEVGRTKDVVCFLADALFDVRPDMDAFASAKPSPLVADAALREQWSAHISAGDGKLKVGLAWRSMLQNTARNRNYLKVDDLEPLGSLQDVEFWLLQPRPTDAELERLATLVDLRIPEELDMVNDLEGQVAFASCLDAVVAPYMTTAELAAATGVPTAMLGVTRATLWRRRPDGTDIFRPNARIFQVQSGRPESMGGVVEFIAGLAAAQGVRAQ